MAGNRIKVAKSKAKLLASLIEASEITGVFQTYVDVIVFAAALGAKRKKRIPIEEISRKEPEPIPQEHFISRGYENVINLLALADTQDVNVLTKDEISEEERIKIFEEYANAGLQILEDSLKGSVSHLDRILLFLTLEKNETAEHNREFDLSHFIPC